MNIYPLSRALTSAADILLPELCAVCGQPLSGRRSEKYFTAPLCSECAAAADANIFYNRYPRLKRCRFCGYPLTSEDGICSRCREKEWNFSSSTSLFIYMDIAKQLISSYKFGNRKNLAEYFAFHLSGIHNKNYSGYTVVPVPFRPSAKRKRGWDQIGILCSILRSRYFIPVELCLVRKNGAAQKTMSYSERFLNLENRISLKKKQVITFQGASCRRRFYYRCNNGLLRRNTAARRGCGCQRTCYCY